MPAWSIRTAISIVVATALAIEQWARLPAPLGLATSDDSGDRDVVIYRLAR